MSYQTEIQNLIRPFSHIQFENLSRAHHKHADALATLTFKIDVPDEAIDVRIVKKTFASQYNGPTPY